MALEIPSRDRILNRYEVADPDDKTVLNADNIMLIFDSLVNGEYALKPAKQYSYYANLQLETEMEAGQTAYVLEEGYRDKLFIYNGSEWITIGNSETIDYSIKEKEYELINGNLSVMTDLDLENVISYIILLNGLKIKEGDDYTISTTNNVSTINLSETNEGIITVIYQG